MFNPTRRNIFKACLAGAVVSPFSNLAAASTASAKTCVNTDVKSGAKQGAKPVWGQGIEGQRKADLGNGTYLNPIIAGDHPDPTILKDGELGTHWPSLAKKYWHCVGTGFVQTQQSLLHLHSCRTR